MMNLCEIIKEQKMNSELLQLLACFGSVRIYSSDQEWIAIFRVVYNGIKYDISSEYQNSPKEAEEALIAKMKHNNINFAINDKIYCFHDLNKIQITHYLKILKKAIIE